MDDALLGPDPAQLAVADELVPERREVVDDGPSVRPTTSGAERLDRGDAELVAAAGGEGDAVTLEPVRSGRS